MTDTSNDIALCAEWMRLQAVCLSRSDAERALFAMTAEWLTDWVETDRFRDEPAIRQFISACLQKHGAEYRLTQTGTSPLGPVLH
jgi:hypothetical protein